MPLQEFLVTPLQLGMPYSRPRYYALGRQKSANDSSCSFPVPALPSGKPFAGPPGPLLSSLQAGKNDGTLQLAQAADSHVAIAPVSRYLDRESADEKALAESRPCLAVADSTIAKDDQPVKPQTQQDERHASAAGKVQATADTGQGEADPNDSLPQRSALPVHEHNHVHVHQSAAGSGCRMPGANDASARHEEGQKLSYEAEGVPRNVIEQWGQSLDIVGPDSKRCNCFTKTYFRWVKARSKIDGPHQRFCISRKCWVKASIDNPGQQNCPF